MTCKIGYGTWGLGGVDYGSVSEKKAFQLVSYAFQKGINFFDTAPLYGNGQSEKALGKLVSNIKRSSITICTKCGMQPHRGFRMKQNFTKKFIKQDIERSLERLNTDYLDIVLLHSPNTLHDVDDSLDFLDHQKKNGILKNIGISLRSPFDIKSFNYKLIDYFEVNFNLLDQRLLDIDLNKYKNKKFIARTPLNFGFLTNKDLHKNNFEKTDHRRFWSGKQLDNWNLFKKVFYYYVSKYNYKEISEFALKFVLSAPRVEFVIPGMLSKNEINKNLNILIDKKINPIDLKNINRIYKSIENDIFIQKRKR